MRVLIALALVASVYAANDCAEVSIAAHAQAPSYVDSDPVGAGGTFVVDNSVTKLQLKFNVDCAFQTQSGNVQGSAPSNTGIQASRSWTMGGAAATEAVAYSEISTTNPERASGQVTIQATWANIALQEVPSPTPKTRIFGFLVEFTGTTDHLGDYGGTNTLVGTQLGAFDMERTIVEIYRFQCRFEAEIDVNVSVIFKYSVIDYQYLLVATRTSLSGTAATAAALTAQELYIEIIVRTMVLAPFKINDGGFTTKTLAKGNTNYNLESMTIDSVTYTSGQNIRTVNCVGPYTTASSLTDNRFMAHATTGANAPMCTQDWWFATKLDIVGGNCKLDGATLSVSQATQGILCGPFDTTGHVAFSNANGDTNAGTAYDDTFVCPIVGNPPTPDTVDDFAMAFDISTSNACPTLVLETDAIAAMTLTDKNGVELTRTSSTAAYPLNVNDEFKIRVYAGVDDSNNAEWYLKSMSIQSASVSGDSQCETGSCSETWDDADFTLFPADDGTDGNGSDDGCEKNIVAPTPGANVDLPTGNTAFDCFKTTTLATPLNKAKFDLVENITGGQVATLSFTATINVVIEDGGSGFGATARKRTLEVRTKKSDFYSLLQEGETVAGKVDVVAAAGLTSTPAEVVEVEEVQTAPETAAEEELLIAEETSSNLVYIVVGVLLALSVAIAAVVMYMRRVKGSKKAQPVVPVPITIETQGSSTTA